MRNKPINLTTFITHIILVIVGCSCINLDPDGVSVKNLLENSIEVNTPKLN
jgi:hypothetical protein